MEFRRLRLAGFKSFVEPAELRIEPGLTGVVGPNGCGKSNLLEALRWVMGEGSPKSMRSGGMDDVIFVGTGSRPARSMASVTLALAAAGGEEIEVSRRIERGAGSDYRVNGRDARLQDVRLLFADNATGAHSPAIVGQGRIGEIIAAKPTERRALLEEAAGIAGLHVRRREAEIRLRAAEANVGRLEDVIRALETQAASLRRQAKSAERYRALSDRLKIAEARLVHARWKAALATAEAATAAAAQAEQQVGELSRVAAGLAAAVAMAAAALPALRQAESEAAAAQQALLQNRALLDAEAQALGRRLADLERDGAALVRDMAREASLGDEAKAADARLSAEDATLASRLADVSAAAPGLTSAVAEAEAAAQTAEANLADAIAAHAAAAAEQRGAEAALAEANGRAARAQQEAERLARLRAQLKPVADLAPLTAAAEAAARDLGTAEAALTAAEAARPAAEAARGEAASALAAGRAALSALVSEAEALARRLAADTGKEPRIADRIEAAAGYEAALAAALGDDIDAAGADSAATRRWAGSPRNDDDPALPSGIRPLSAMVKAPAELFRRLAQIGVVDAPPSPELLGALRPGQRIVTMAGALFRWDGFVDTGGRSDAAAARLRARRRATELAAERADAEALLGAAEATFRDADAAYAAALAAEREARESRSRAVRAAEAARAQLAAAETAAARAVGEAETLAAAEARTAAELERVRTEVQAARDRLGLGEKVRELAQALAQARAAADTVRGALVGARAAADRGAREIESATARRAAIVEERKSWADRLAASAAQRGELAARAAAAESDAKAIAARRTEIGEELAALATRTATANDARRAAGDALAAAEAAMREDERRARAADEAVAAAREARAANKAEAEHAATARREIEMHCGERFQCPPTLLPGRSGFPVDDADAPALQAEFDALTAERERLGPVNLRADIELAELDEQAKGTAAEKAELDTAIARLRGSIGNLNREGRTRLSQAFVEVDRHFRALFTGLFGGGEARLELIESEDPLEAGLEIMAQPPGKKLQSLNLLSGGEQALTATALIFGLFLANPAPICVLDEVDAPLDDANVERFCDLLDRMAADTATRFLIVTHNAVTMSRMHRLYGVTMGEPGVSQLVSVDLQGAEELLAAE